MGFSAWLKNVPREFDNHAIAFTPRAPQSPLARSAFLRVVDHITKIQRDRKCAVDYVLGSLVFDIFAAIRRVVQDHVDDRSEMGKLLGALDAAEMHVKFSYISGHAGKDDESAFHDRSFALSQSNTGTVHCESSCGQCLAPFQILQEAQLQCLNGNESDGSRDDIITLFQDSRCMLLLFYGHQTTLFEPTDPYRCSVRVTALGDFK